MKKYLEAGRIVNTHGTRGEVKITPWADNADFLKQFKHFYIDEKPFEITASRVHKQSLIAKLSGIDNINDAMVLKNKVIFIDRVDAKLPEGQNFVQDLIGMSVVEEDGSELGKLSEVLNMPAGDVYVVKGKREILIPVVPQFILKKDMENGIITVRLIDGM